MFTLDDYSLIDPHYFKALKMSEKKIEIQSRCTGHVWKLVPMDGGPVTIYHKHFYNHPYHWHNVALDLQDAIEEIKGHDEFQMNNRKCPYTVYTREGVVKNGRLFRY